MATRKKKKNKATGFFESANLRDSDVWTRRCLALGKLCAAVAAVIVALTKLVGSFC